MSSQIESDNLKKSGHKKRSKKKQLLEISSRERQWDNRIYNVVQFEPISLKLITKSLDDKSQKIRFQRLDGMRSTYKDPERFSEKPQKMPFLNSSRIMQGQYFHFSNAQVVQKYIKMNQDTVSKENDTMEHTFSINIDEKKKHLFNLWSEFKIPECHQNYFKQLLSAENMALINETIDEEITQITEKTSFIQKCLFASSAREKCIRILMQHIETINQIGDYYQMESEAQTQYIQRASELLLHLRLLTLNVTENIQKWRSYLLQKKQLLLKLTNLKEYYIFEIQQSKNLNQTTPTKYLLKFNDDYYRIKNSILQNFFVFSENSDPFFLYILQGSKQLPMTSSHKKNFQEIQTRIRNCEFELLLCDYYSKYDQ